MSHPEKRPVTIEDLLRLKATERPPAEFWEKFDRELRAKQLAALVEKRPWWQRMPNVFAGWRRYHLPLGATAVLAVTFLSVHDFSYKSSDPAAEADNATVAAAARVTAVPAASEAIVVSARAVESGGEQVAINAASTATEDVASTASAASGGVAPGEVARLVNQFPAAEPNNDTLAPSARHIAANLAAVEAVEPVLGRGLLEGTRQNRATSRTTVEPLAQVTPPGGARMAKFRSAMAVSFAQTSLHRGDERVVRELNDRLTEEAARRIGAKGNEVSYKF